MKLTAGRLKQLIRETIKFEIMRAGEEEILDEVKDEGGALGMKNLKEIADKKKLNQTISDMKDEGKLFEHKDGDFYTHKPK